MNGGTLARLTDSDVRAVISRHLLVWWATRKSPGWLAAPGLFFSGKRRRAAVLELCSRLAYFALLWHAVGLVSAMFAGFKRPIPTIAMYVF